MSPRGHGALQTASVVMFLYPLTLTCLNSQNVLKISSSPILYSSSDCVSVTHWTVVALPHVKRISPSNNNMTIFIRSASRTARRPTTPRACPPLPFAGATTRTWGCPPSAVWATPPERRAWPTSTRPSGAPMWSISTGKAALIYTVIS